MECVNCGSVVTGNFCQFCGQPNPPPQITFSKIFHDVQAQFYGFDKMFPRTVKDVTRHPGKTSRIFIKGNRVLYFGPAAYFFLMITIMLLVMSALNVDFMVFMRTVTKATRPAIVTGSVNDQLSELILKFVNENLRIFAFTLIPLQAICSRYIFFRKRNFTLLQHVILPLYIQGHIYWLTIMSVILFRITGSPLPYSFTIIISLAYFGFAFSDFFNQSLHLKTFLKGIGVFIVSQTLFGIIVVIGIIIAAAVYPDIFKMLIPSTR